MVVTHDIVSGVIFHFWKWTLLYTPIHLYLIYIVYLFFRRSFSLSKTTQQVTLSCLLNFHQDVTPGAVPGNQQEVHFLRW